MPVEEWKSGARKLPEDQRFELLADLLGSLPVVLSDVDDGSEDNDGANKTAIPTPHTQRVESFMTVQTATQKSERALGQAQDDSDAQK